jgi:hypothetical protein
MKTLNQFRKTNTINITNCDLEQMMLIHKYLDYNGCKLIGIASIDLHNYVARIDEVLNIVDVQLTIRGNRVIETDRVIIFKMSHVTLGQRVIGANEFGIVG